MEILFKARKLNEDGTRGDWVEGTGVTDFLNSIESNGRTYLWSSNYCWTEIDPETVCQYICREDKDGVKIFSGDEVEWADACGEVYFYDKVCGFAIKNKDGIFGPYQHCGIISVTGNIHND